MNLFSLSGLLISATSLFFSVLVFIVGRERKSNLLWAFFCFVVSFWGAGVYKIGFANEPSDALFWWRFAHIGIIFIPVIFLHYVYVFLGIRRQLVVRAVYLSGAVFLIFDLFTNLFIANMRFVFNSFYYDSPPTFLYIIFVIFFFGVIVYSHYELLVALKKVSGNKKAQIKYFFIATNIGFSGGAFSYLPVFGIDMYPFLNFTVILYPIIMTYAIITHHLLDIKWVLRRYVVFLISVGTLALPSALIINYFYDNYPDIAVGSNLAAMAIAFFVFPGLRDRIYKMANRYFFSSLYDTREIISAVSEKLQLTLDVNRIYESISSVLLSALHVKAAEVLIYDEHYSAYESQHDQVGDGMEFSKLSAQREGGFVRISTVLQEDYLMRNNIVVVDELRNQKPERYADMISFLDVAKIAALVPLNAKEKKIGLIALTTKESGDMFNDEDLYVLKVIGAQSAIALENALLYKETLNFNEKLKHEVHKATIELVNANQKLTKLDMAKSEFISIASHQLRTPLTVIKGYISMILEGNFGALTEGEKISLVKVYESNERLIQLVEGLLNVSRIESGRLQFAFAEKDLGELVQSVFEELETTASKKGLLFSLKRPAKLPLVRIDEEKMRQVVMNLMDNAIKYTKKGSVTVTLRKKDEGVEFCVSDSGMGVNAEDMKNLFKKFSRGTDSSLVHTEGTGLGLYVVKEMLKAHSGKAWVESGGVGRGSKFYFWLPSKI